MFCINVVAAPTAYEIERMQRCLRNNVYLRQLGLDQMSSLIKNTGIP
jgi:hypothetical protein